MSPPNNLFEDEVPPGLVVIHDWISSEEHDELVREIDSFPFESSISRRTQHYGYRYIYAAGVLDESAVVPDPPRMLKALAVRLAAEGHFDRTPDQVIVNEYVGAQGIAAHSDSRLFGPVVATVSLIETWPMLFRSRFGDELQVWLECRSLVLMTGPSRSTWTHEIGKRKADRRGGLRLDRGRRLSATFRTVDSAGGAR